MSLPLLPHATVQGMSVVFIAAAVIVVLSSLLHAKSVAEWRGVLLLSLFSVLVATAAVLALRLANQFMIKLVRQQTSNTLAIWHTLMHWSTGPLACDLNVAWVVRLWYCRHRCDPCAHADQAAAHRRWHTLLYW